MNAADILGIKQRFGIIGNSPLLNVAIEKAALAAPTDMTVLITGESGSGKESFSKIIHQLSSRKHNQFIAINCGAIPEGTIDSELFGHEKGAFTGAVDSRKGYFETVSGGTIFLDEIGEMPLGTQARLLRVLENGEFIRVGSSKVQKTDVRVVAATNVDLMQAVEKGTFREDLYYRLNTIPIYVPPLRERGTDIVLLFRKFATDFAEKYRVKSISLSEEASEVLVQYRFPGNIRQLKNLVEQISVLELDREINDTKLRSYLPASQNQSNYLPALTKMTENQNFSERDLLYKVLFDLKRDVTELKKLFYETITGKSINREVLNEHAELFRELEHEPISRPSVNNGTPILLDSRTTEPEEDDDLNIAMIEDIPHETEDVSLNMRNKEKEMIIRALSKNRNKRKYAAADLGISERTLYRKIKEYNIE